MKKIILAGFLTLTITMTMSGCGKPKQTVPVSTSTLPHETMPALVTAEPKPSVTTGNGDKQDYAMQRDAAVSAMNETMEKRLPELMDQALLIQSETALNQWLRDFASVKGGVEKLSGELANLTALAPESQLVTQTELTVAAAAIDDALDGFEDALQAASGGDSEAFGVELNDFAEKLQKAKELWADAVK